MHPRFVIEVQRFALCTCGGACAKKIVKRMHLMHPTSPQRLTTSFFFSATFHVHLRNEMVWRRCTARVSYTPYRPTISIEPTAALRTVSMTPHVAQRLAHSRFTTFAPTVHHHFILVSRASSMQNRREPGVIEANRCPTTNRGCIVQTSETLRRSTSFLPLVSPQGTGGERSGRAPFHEALYLWSETYGG